MKKFAIRAALALGVVGIALALTTFDPATGLGFVGKGDLQTPWGWNDQTLQAQAAGVTFSYSSASDYEVTCEFDTGPTTHRVHHVITTPVNDSVAYDVSSASRKNPQGKVTGFNLTGLGTPVESGDPVPAVGDSCIGEPLGALVTSVTLVAGSQSDTLSASSAAPTGPTVIWANGVSVHP